MGFAGNISRVRHLQQIERALTRGYAPHPKTNTCVTLEGEATPLMTYEGRQWHVSGMMHFAHYGTRVLSVDFDRDRITDYGYRGYSVTTDVNLTAWSRALDRTDFLNTRSVVWALNYAQWSIFDRQAPKNTREEHMRDMLVRFRAGVPWLQVVDGATWFCGGLYRGADAQAYHRFWHGLDANSNDWRWFTADWDTAGRWVRRFIDADAERRWYQRTTKHKQAYAIAEAVEP